MNRTRRTLLAALAAATAPFPVALRAQSAGDAGYTTLPKALPVEQPGKIEMAEFFWYGCPHCYSLEPRIEAWIPQLPKDAYFRRIPAVFNERWARDAATFFTFEALGVLAKLHRPFFDAIHRDHLRTDNPEAMTEWLGRNGVDARKFDEMSRSFAVQSKVKQAAQLSAASQIDGTPALMVQGRYTVSAEQGRTPGGMLANAERLIPIVRKSLAAGK